MPEITIKNRYDDKPVWTGKATSRDDAIRIAITNGADLRGADLSGANLSDADLRSADLSRAYLSRAYLRGADLSRAYLSRAYLRSADLRGANLSGALLNWQSHDLIAEILRCAADSDFEKRKIAGLVLISRDWCWNDFLRLHNEPLFSWAIDTLAAWVRPDDGAPEILHKQIVGASPQTP